jgi:uncharacterized membrane protein YebE (DUF533 family)
MGLANTLIKVAIGVAIAKGVSSLVKGGSGGGQSTAGRDGLRDVMDGIGGADGRTTAKGGSLDDLLGDLGQPETARGTQSRRANAPKGGLEDLLGSLGGGATSSGAQGGGLGDLLGQLTGGGQTGRGQTGGAAQGGALGDLLGQLTGGGQSGQTGRTTQGGGGLGDLLGQLTGGGQTGQTTQGGGGLGDLLGKLTGGGQKAGGGGLGDLLGAVLGGTAGGALASQPSETHQDLAATLILRAMIQAAKSDGKFDDAERQKLMEHAAEASDEERALIQSEFKRDFTPEELAGQVPEGMEAQIYLMSILAIDLDNRTEAAYLDRLAKGLSLAPQVVNQLHDKAGAAHLYS